ncbi:MAG TPA: DUF4811 domain-containing protein [Lactobacillus sp.]|nr:DUF4811 domain-containing protein [Lactobacillus sp.]
MILVTLVIGAIALFICFVYFKNRVWQIIGTLLSIIVLCGSLFMITQNDHNHFGMHKVTTTTTKRIYSASGSSANGVNMVLYQNIGSKGTENVQIYATKADQKKPGHTQADEFTTNKIKKASGNKATLKTTETRWEYKNHTAKVWFGVAKSHHKLTKRVNTFYLPSSWLHLSTTQAKQLKSQMAKMQTPQAKTQMKQQAEAYVKGKLQAAAMKDPSIATDKAKQAKLSKQYAAEFQSQLIKKAVASVK